VGGPAFSIAVESKGLKSMILRGSDVKVVRTEEGDLFGLYVDGTLRVSGLPDEIIRHLLHSFDIGFQHVSLTDTVIDTFDGILPQNYRELFEVIEDEENCNL
jgi:hypothetical protein